MSTSSQAQPSVPPFIQKMQDEMKKEYQKLQDLYKQTQKLLPSRLTLQSQLQENNNVMEELILLKENNKLYKQIGPVMVIQDFDEAKNNVKERLNLIQEQINRLNSQIDVLEQQKAEAQKKTKFEKIIEESQKQANTNE